ncbi:MAG TPA: hypothetical protein VFU21_14175 [Kofleriaceae bacterium]|nr:hypothetical protein [Kofleriaceae bacterium]
MKTKPATKNEPKKSRTLFGLSPDELKMVVGGTGIIQQGPRK